MNNNIYLLCGLPGSGKTTWAKAQNGIHISRDEIRFSMLNKNEEYFGKEIEVFNTFVRKCNEAILAKENKDVYIDATHLNEKSRKKVLNRLTLGADDKVIAVYFNVPISVCIYRNNQRSGLAKVPEKIIYNMQKVMTEPTMKEYPYADIKFVYVKPSFTTKLRRNKND